MHTMHICGVSYDTIVDQKDVVVYIMVVIVSFTCTMLLFIFSFLNAICVQIYYET